MSDPAKLTPEHLRRRALVDIRQSSAQQDSRLSDIPQANSSIGAPDGGPIETAAPNQSTVPRLRSASSAMRVELTQIEPSKNGQAEFSLDLL